MMAKIGAIAASIFRQKSAVCEKRGIEIHPFLVMTWSSSANIASTPLTTLRPTTFIRLEGKGIAFPGQKKSRSAIGCPRLAVESVAPRCHAERTALSRSQDRFSELGHSLQLNRYRMSRGVSVSGNIRLAIREARRNQSLRRHPRLKAIRERRAAEAAWTCARQARCQGAISAQILGRDENGGRQSRKTLCLSRFSWPGRSGPAATAAPLPKSQFPRIRRPSHETL